MNSPFAKIYQSIIERVQSEVPEIAHIDLNLGQLEGYTLRPEMIFPALLIEFDNWDFTNMSDKTQRGQGNVIFILAFAQYNNSSNLNENQWRESGIEYLEIEHKLHQCIHGWSPGEEYYGAFTRTKAQSINAPMSVRLRPITYHIEIEDYDTQPTPNLISVPDVEFSN